MKRKQHNLVSAAIRPLKRTRTTTTQHQPVLQDLFMAMLATTVAEVKGQEVVVVMAVVVEKMVVLIDPEGKEMITEGADIHEVIEEEVKQTEEEVGEKEVEMKVKEENLAKNVSSVMETMPPLNVAI